MVRIRYRGELAALTGVGEEAVEAAGVRDVLRHIKAAHGPAAQKAAKRMLITVNQKSVALLQNRNTPLKEGDTVSFWPVCGGG